MKPTIDGNLNSAQVPDTMAVGNAAEVGHTTEAPAPPSAESPASVDAAVQAPFFHSDSSCVRFWVVVDGQQVGAMISRDTLHYAFRPQAQGEDPLATYRACSKEIDAAVQRRVAKGSIEPVIVREFDLR